MDGRTPDDGGQMEMDLFAEGGTAQVPRPRFDNRWRRPGVMVSLHPPRGTVWRPGLWFARQVLDPAVGAEVCVLFRAPTEEAGAVARSLPVSMALRPVILPTEAGAVLCILVSLAGVPCRIVRRTFLDAGDPATLRLLKLAARQTHVKLIVYDLERVEVVALADVENDFGLEATRDEVARMQSQGSRCSFNAVNLAAGRYTTEDLLKLAGDFGG